MYRIWWLRTYALLVFPQQHKNWYVILPGHYLAATLFGRISVWLRTSLLPSGDTSPCVCVCERESI